MYELGMLRRLKPLFLAQTNQGCLREMTRISRLLRQHLAVVYNLSTLCEQIILSTYM